MNGFSQVAIWEGKDGVNEMTMWPPEKVPIITTLAKEFALFDRWFASYPGSTTPNRSFLLSGTAKGCEDTSCHIYTIFDQKTIFKQLDENNIDWKIYTGGFPSLGNFCINLNDLHTKSSLDKIKLMSHF
jgi:phospholipase C